MAKTIKIKCACGQEFDLPNPGRATCKCGMIYWATQEGIFWDKPEKKEGSDNVSRHQA